MLKETIIVSVIVFGILTISSTDGKPRPRLVQASVSSLHHGSIFRGR